MMPDNTYRIGIDLGGTKIEVAVIDADDRFLLRKRVPTPQGDYAATIAAIADLVREARNAHGSDAPVGIGMPGSLTSAGVIQNANSTVLIGRPLLDDIATAIGSSVRGENDANCLARSEAHGGASTGARVSFAVILGTGVGGAIAIDGTPLSGAHAIAGEWGHNPLPWQRLEEFPGGRCYCGKDGCIETWLSGPAFEASYRRATGRACSATEIVARSATEPEARNALDRYEHRLARALATVINVVDPEIIVAGGGMSNIAELYTVLPNVIRKYVFSSDYRLRFVPAAFGDSSGVRGAAMLAGAIR